MTVTPLPLFDYSQPRNHGQPWDEESTEEMLAAAAAGRPLAEIADLAGRTVQSVAQRLRRLLRPEQRSCPSDRIVPVLATNLEDETYDWRVVIVQPNLRPPQPAPIHKQGIDGLTDAQLAAFAHSLLLSRGPTKSAVMAEVLDEVRSRRVWHEVIVLQQRRLQAAGALASVALQEARTWLGLVGGVDLDEPWRYSWVTDPPYDDPYYD